MDLGCILLAYVLAAGWPAIGLKLSTLLGHLLSSPV